jgi:excisionase family DNA binding protein
MEQRLLSITDFVRIFRVSRSTTYREINDGRLTLIKIGSRSFIATEDAEKWLELHRGASHA